MAGTIVVDRIESDASYTSSINVANRITFSNTVNFGVFAGTAPVAGFYLPATNTLSFTTASTERMRIDSAGNVGIGTTTPGTTPGAGQLVVVGGDVPFATNDNANMVVRTTDATAINKGGMIGLGGVSESGNLTFATIKGAKEGTDSGYLAFATRTAAAYATERMRITSAGLLQFNSGYGSVATAYGCRAWVNFNGQGTPAARASGNVSSITDVGVGRYTIIFTTAMPDTNYACVVGSGDNIAANDVGNCTQISSAASVPYLHYESSTFQDVTQLFLAVFR
jgi:hypothetical protein